MLFTKGSLWCSLTFLDSCSCLAFTQRAVKGWVEEQKERLGQNIMAGSTLHSATTFLFDDLYSWHGFIPISVQRKENNKQSVLCTLSCLKIHAQSVMLTVRQTSLGLLVSRGAGQYCALLLLGLACWLTVDKDFTCLKLVFLMSES